MIDTEAAKESALEFTAVLREQWTEAQRRIQEYIVEQPSQALVAAMAMGVLLAWLIKRQ